MDQEFGSDGRLVRCSKCSHRWKHPPAKDGDAISKAISKGAQNMDSGDRVPLLGTPLKADAPLMSVRSESAKKDDLAASFLTQFRWLPAAGLWLTVLGVFGGATYSAYWNRDAVMERFAFSVPLFDFLGVEAKNPAHYFNLSNLRLRREIVDQNLAQFVEFELKNVSASKRNIPLARVIILDAEEKIIRDTQFPMGDFQMASGEKRPFSSRIDAPLPQNGVLKVVLEHRAGIR
jgi:hypothetical protein